MQDLFIICRATEMIMIHGVQILAMTVSLSFKALQGRTQVVIDGTMSGLVIGHVSLM
jgi:hypothetical protein